MKSGDEKRGEIAFSKSQKLKLNILIINYFVFY